jgi:predicted transcriptional regulator with HTH domain
LNNDITDDSDAEILQLYLRVLGKSKKLLLKLSTKYQRLSEVNPYSGRTLVYHHAKRLEKLELIECTTISRAKFCKLTEKGKKVKELILEKKRKAKEKTKKEKDHQQLDFLEQLRALQSFALLSSQAITTTLGSAEVS